MTESDFAELEALLQEIADRAQSRDELIRAIRAQEAASRLRAQAIVTTDSAARRASDHLP